ncbi:hypothetical protein N9295_01085 [bacterium]|nr:hypothetical protein [Candidatus Poseidoniales archaeon]MDA8717650.1 hypothetical protein [Candidatus Poseidoniales archaeon]MDB2367404.1 hypothetical protein [Candidatus Poseidoniales archaeon]MDB3879428.1 hypothetical protein [bacterium]
MRVFQLDSYVLLLSGKDCLKFLDGLSTNKVDGTCTTVFTNSNAKIIDMVEVIVVGENLALVGHSLYKEDLLEHLNSRILQQDVSMRDISEFNNVYISFDEYPKEDNITVVRTFRGWIIVAPTSRIIESTLTLDAFNEYRIQNEIPHQGYEITPSRHPFNCRLEHLVHESKGCYIGQEILTRMRSRGNMGKSLMRIEGTPDDATTVGKTHSLVIHRL